MNDDALCAVCGINELVNERERLDGVCDDCNEELDPEFAEQDFDEQLYAQLDLMEEN